MREESEVQVPFDRVLVSIRGRTHELSAREFLALPLHRRMRHLLNGEVMFYSGERAVDRRTALDGLRESG